MHPENNAAATSATAMLASGMASIQRLVLSMMVRVCVSLGGGQQPHKVNVDVGKPALPNGNGQHFNLNMAVDF